MSIESATAFINKVMNDKSFATLVKSAETAEEKFRIARDACFDFTLEEMEQAKSDIPLSDEELDGLSGGMADNSEPRYIYRIEPCDGFACSC
jgi:predicted ribosomally synthesized peptide with nif11-like leader